MSGKQTDYNLIMVSTFGMPIMELIFVTSCRNDNLIMYVFRNVVFPDSVRYKCTYKLKLSGGDIKAVQGGFLTMHMRTWCILICLQVESYMNTLPKLILRRVIWRISDKGNGKEARCNGRTESNGYDEMDRIDE